MYRNPRCIRWEERLNLAKLNLYALAVDDAARKKNPLTNKIGDKTVARSMLEVVRAIVIDNSMRSVTLNEVIEFEMGHERVGVTNGNSV